MIDQMTALTGQGLSTAKVAAAMGVSKGAVIGKAHRIRLQLNDSGTMLRAAFVAKPELRTLLRDKMRLKNTGGRMKRKRSPRVRAPKIAAATLRRDKRVHTKPGRICFLLGMR